LGEPRLRAEAAVLGAPPGLRVHERAHVRGVAEAVEPRLERALDQRLDLGVVLDLAEGERFLVGNQGRHRRGQGTAAAGRLRGVSAPSSAAVASRRTSGSPRGSPPRRSTTRGAPPARARASRAGATGARAARGSPACCPRARAAHWPRARSPSRAPPPRARSARPPG